MEACPVCRASLNGASTCRRCRAELHKVQEVERRGQVLVGAAMRSLAEGDLAVAEELLGRARAVHATPAVRILRRLVTELQLVEEGAEDDRPSYVEGPEL